MKRTIAGILTIALVLGSCPSIGARENESTKMSTVEKTIEENQTGGTKKDYVVMTDEKTSLTNKVQSVDMTPETAKKLKKSIQML